MEKPLGHLGGGGDVCKYVRLDIPTDIHIYAMGSPISFLEGIGPLGAMPKKRERER
jgi:hypothetical protein